MKNKLLLTTVSLLAGVLILPALATATEAITPTGKDGQPLNLDFETGTLKDWVAEGKAFAKQPVHGDTVSVRRTDMKSGHTGGFWVGSFETGGDAPKGTLTSVSFKVTQPFASFLVAGGSHENTRVELVRADTRDVIARFGQTGRRLAAVG